MTAENATKPKKLLSLEEARASVSKSLKDRLGKIWDKAMSVTEETQNLPENIKRYPIERPTTELNKAIQNALANKSLNPRKQSINLRQIWHIHDRHGEGNESYADQNPVTKETFMLIPDVLKNFDSVKKGKWTVDSNKQNTRSVEISKAYSDGTVILADAIVDNDGLEIKTMVLKKPTEVRSKHANAPLSSLLSPNSSVLQGSNIPGSGERGTKPANGNIANY